MNYDVTIQGRYLSDVFLIEFPPHVRIFSRDGSQGPKSAADFATFVHEYWHYLLNISTSRGYKDFALWQQLIPIFSHTLMQDQDGTSAGSDPQSPFREHIEDVEKILYNYMGEGIQNSLNGAVALDVEVYGKALIADAGLSLRGHRVPYKRVSIPIIVHTSDRKKIHSQYVLGNIAINESIANAVERMVFDDDKVPPVDPYLILDRITRFYNKGVSLSQYEIAALGTLSYLSTDAATSFILLLEDYVSYRKKKTIRESLRTLQQVFMPGFTQIHSTLVQDLQSLKSIYDKRQPLEMSLNFISDKFEEYLKLRADNLLFDLEPFNPDTGACDLKALEKLLFKTVPSCDIRQVLEGDQGEDEIGKDLLRSFDTQVHNLNGNMVYSSYLMQVFQCAFRFFRAHWAFDSFIRSEIANDRCPYYTTCDLPTRVNKPHICKSKPWLSMSYTEQNCMYGSAAAALLGHVTIKKNDG